MTTTNRLRQTTLLEWMTDPQAVRSRARQHGRRVRRASAVAALWAVAIGFTLAWPEPANAQGGVGTIFPAERVVGDAAGSPTEHFSIDQHGLVTNPTEYVSVGMRALGSGQGLHILRYGTNYLPLAGGEALLVPVGSNDIVGYSVDTMANGELLIAGEFGGSGPFNVFVCRMKRDLSGIVWSKQLPGTQYGWPSVTARELRDGTIIVTHNERSDPNNPFGPEFGRLTRLTANGLLMWSTQHRVPGAPGGQLRFTDVRQKPAAAGNDLIVAGYAGTGFNVSAMLLDINLGDGCWQGECGTLYPHPSFESTTFAALYFDERPGGSPYTLVAAGAAFGSDFMSPTFPRVLDVSGINVPPNWDRVYDVQMTPAPTALTVRRAAYLGAPAHVVVAGTEETMIVAKRQARLLTLDANAAGAFSSGRTFGNGVPPHTNFNDVCDSQVMVGGRDDLVGPIELYFTPGGTNCAAPYSATDVGPGTWTPFCPDCEHDLQISDLPLIQLGTLSIDRTICRYRMPNPDNSKAFRWP